MRGPNPLSKRKTKSKRRGTLSAGLEYQNLEARNLLAGLYADVSLVSAYSDSTSSPNDTFQPAISGDGRFVVFGSVRSDLVSSDTNGNSDIFITDTDTGVTTRVSVDSAGGEANGDSYRPSISDDGRYVAFESNATNLLGGNDAGLNVYVKDLQDGSVELVSVNTSGSVGNGDSNDAVISGNGRYVAFASLADDLVADDFNGSQDVFRRDIISDVTVRVSLDSDGDESVGDSSNPSISETGQYVAFQSVAVLDGDDTNGVMDVYRKDLISRTTNIVSESVFGIVGNDASYDASISDDGRNISFSSEATNLIHGSINANGFTDVYKKNMQWSTVAWISEEAVADAFGSAVSGDGLSVTFVTQSALLTNGDVNGFQDVFVYEEFVGMTLEVLIRSQAVVTTHLLFPRLTQTARQFIS